jgi:hypothetical protein
MRAEVVEAAPTMSRGAVASWLVGSERVSLRFTIKSIIIPNLYPIANVSNTKTTTTLMKDVKP